MSDEVEPGQPGSGSDAIAAVKRHVHHICLQLEAIATNVQNAPWR